MKRVLSAVFAIFAFFEMTYFCSAVNQPQSLGFVTFSHSTMTITDVNKTTAPAVGYPLWCTNCLANGGVGTLCTSTGAANVFQWILSTGSRCQ